MSYSEKVVDHFENPQNMGSLDKNDLSVGTGLVGAPACGDVMKLQIKIGEDGIIEDAKFKTFGCGSAIASSSLIISNNFCADTVVSPGSITCVSMLAEIAICKSVPMI